MVDVHGVDCVEGRGKGEREREERVKGKGGDFVFFS